MTHFLVCNTREDIIALIHDNIIVSRFIIFACFLTQGTLCFFLERSLFYEETTNACNYIICRKIHNIIALGYGYGIVVTGREQLYSR